MAMSPGVGGGKAPLAPAHAASSTSSASSPLYLLTTIEHDVLQ